MGNIQVEYYAKMVATLKKEKAYLLKKLKETNEIAIGWCDCGQSSCTVNIDALKKIKEKSKID